MPQRTWQLFLSPGTLLTALAAVGVWSIQFDWVTGLLLVLLLYIHEAGHTLAALWRRVPVASAPVFLPGLGAFVLTAPGRTAWDEVWVALGGPLVGGSAALVAKGVGLGLGLPALAGAGQFGLYINLVNLLPASFLDGGRAASRTGWLGAIPAAVAGFLLYYWGSDISLLFTGLAGLCFYQAYSQVRSSLKAPQGFFTSLAVFTVYAAVFAGLGTALFATGRAYMPRAAESPWIDAFQWVSGGYFGLYLLSGYVFQYAWRPERGARERYLATALLGWPQHLVHNPWFIPFMWLLTAYTFGKETIPRAESLIRRLAERQNVAAAYGCSWVYDVLCRTGRGAEAEAWLERQFPVVQAGGMWAMQALYAQFRALGYERQALACLTREADGRYKPAEVPPQVANNLAWALLVMGRPQEALPFAQAAVAGAPENHNCLDTLGAVLVALGEGAAAEGPLRQALERQNRAGTRVWLARSLGQQGRFAEAAREARRALTEHKGPWPHDEPGPEEIHGWLREWSEEGVADTGI